jgi:microcystin-dependent protein
MAEFPSVAVAQIPASPDLTYPARVEVGPLTLIGPTGENQQPNALDIRTETLRSLTNNLVALVNRIQDDFMDRDGADVPIEDSVQGSYYMRGDMDLGGFKATKLADGTNIRDLITFEQLEDVQFEAEDTLEQILVDRVMFTDGSVPMLASLNMTTFRVTNVGAASVGTDAVRLDAVDAALASVQTDLLRRVGVPQMNADLSFDNVVVIEDNYRPFNMADPTLGSDLVNKKYLDEQLAITGVEDVPIAALIPYAGPKSIIPDNFLLADGREVSRFTYANLFLLIGVAYGTPSSGSVFKLPDMRGRAALPLDNLGGQTKSLITDPNARVLGGKTGVEDIVLTEAQLPSHTHDYDDIYYADDTIAGTEEGDASARDTNNLASSDPLRTTGAAGSASAHANVQPSMAMNWLIRF